ncbi:MAG: hypothetical protein ACXVAX_00335 [Pseudobdellovibrio sp.]
MNCFRMGALVLLLLMQICFVEARADTTGPRVAKTFARTYGFAGTLFDTGFYYSQTEATATPASNNTWKSSTSIVDVKLGYITENHWYYGALYSGRGDDQLLPTTTNGSGFGLGLGYFWYNGFNLRGFYRLNEAFGDYTDGSGFQLDLGYAINPTSSLYLGLNLSYRDVTFKTNKTIAGYQPLDRRDTFPFITVGYLFF